MLALDHQTYRRQPVHSRRSLDPAYLSDTFLVRLPGIPFSVMGTVPACILLSPWYCLIYPELRETIQDPSSRPKNENDICLGRRDCLFIRQVTYHI